MYVYMYICIHVHIHVLKTLWCVGVAFLRVAGYKSMITMAGSLHHIPSRKLSCPLGAANSNGATMMPECLRRTTEHANSE